MAPARRVLSPVSISRRRTELSRPRSRWMARTSTTAPSSKSAARQSARQAARLSTTRESHHMMRSMFSAISGLKNHQTFMDVVGNNIANVNTTGFKQSRVTFQDILSQTIRGASGPQNGRGGVNPEQVGLGVLLSGVDTIQTQGTLQSTGKLTDMAIQGEGYFVVNDGKQNFYTRDGAFDLGIDGTLLNPASGLKVMGWQADPVTGAVDTSAPPTSINIPIGAGMTGKASTTL